jgi:hypothetical protein
MDEKRVESEIERFTSGLIPMGYLDIKSAVQTALDGGHDGDWLVEQVNQFCEDTDTALSDVDVNYVAYDSLFQEARNDIDELTGIDIINDLSEEVQVYGNYMCTTLDCSEEAKDEVSKVLKKIPKKDRTEAIKWLVSELDF